MRIPYYHIDAFTDQLFAGNPAGVCLLEQWPDTRLLQHIAAENNLSETAFLVPLNEEKGEWDIRWFTPVCEVDLCGHATLAAASVLHRTRKLADGAILRLHSQSGILNVLLDPPLYRMRFPARAGAPEEVPAALTAALGLQPETVLRSRDLMAVYPDTDTVAALEPDMDALARLDCLGVIVTAPGDDVDFVSRFFAPRVGIDEDPVTGSAHCTLIPYWAERLGKNELVARQISARGGTLFCRYLDLRQVEIAGPAVIYFHTTLSL